MGCKGDLLGHLLFIVDCWDNSVDILFWIAYWGDCSKVLGLIWKKTVVAHQVFDKSP